MFKVGLGIFTLLFSLPSAYSRRAAARTTSSGVSSHAGSNLARINSMKASRVSASAISSRIRAIFSVLFAVLDI